MNGNEIHSKCRICSKPVPANKLAIDPNKKVMACPDCIKGSYSMKVTKKPIDPEDAYLDKMAAKKKQLEIERVDDNSIKYTCSKCRYRFVYNKVKSYPSLCPNCGTKVVFF